MDLNKITLVMDIWEGTSALDTATLYQNGIRGMIIRMNDTVDTLHLDQSFKAHWEASEHFYHIPYFVFAPWLTAIEQYQWIVANLPPEVKVIALDVELDAKLFKQVAIAKKLDDLVFRLQEHGLKVIVYSGSWWWNPTHIDYSGFLPRRPYLDYEYWWAAYPYLLQPNNARVFSTWENLKGLISQIDWQVGDTPGPKCRLRQVCSRYILPGTGGENVDINIFNSNEEQLKSYFGGLDVVPPPPVEEGLSFIAECLVNILNVRKGPGTNYSIVGSIEKGSLSPILDIGGKDIWVKIGDNRWVAVKIGSYIYQNVKAV